MSLRLHCHANNELLAQALVAPISGQLRAAIAARGEAILAVSGGRTPERFLARLSSEPLDWSKVRVTLVDERWVPEDNPRSNARLVKSWLLGHAASAALFVPLYMNEATPEAAITRLRTRLTCLPDTFDVVVLGMGNDGHTASFFPDGDHLAEALNLKGQARVLPMRAPGANEPRVTFTLPALLASRALYLHIEGQAKRALLKAAQTTGSTLPVAAVLRAAPRLEVFWCP